MSRVADFLRGWCVYALFSLRVIVQRRCSDCSPAAHAHAAWRVLSPVCRPTADELMGVNRNLDNEEGVIDDFKDERVCKAFLCGLCPHDLFRSVPCAISCHIMGSDEEGLFRRLRPRASWLLLLLPLTLTLLPLLLPLLRLWLLWLCCFWCWCCRRYFSVETRRSVCPAILVPATTR